MSINGVNPLNTEWKFAKTPSKPLQGFITQDLVKKGKIELPLPVTKLSEKDVQNLFKTFKKIEKPTVLTRLKRIPDVLKNIAKQILKKIR